MRIVPSIANEELTDMLVILEKQEFHEKCNKFLSMKLNSERFQ